MASLVRHFPIVAFPIGNGWWPGHRRPWPEPTRPARGHPLQRPAIGDRRHRVRGPGLDETVISLDETVIRPWPPLGLGTGAPPSPSRGWPVPPASPLASATTPDGPAARRIIGEPLNDMPECSLTPMVRWS